MTGVAGFEPFDALAIAHEPVRVKVPVAPAYLPVPLTIVSGPFLIVTVVGASASAEHAIAPSAYLTFNVSAPLPSVPSPSNGVHCSAGAAAHAFK